MPGAEDEGMAPWSVVVAKLDVLHESITELKIQTAKLVESEKDLARKYEDHEGRLRSLEGAVSKARGALVAAGAIAGLVGGVIVFALERAFS